MASLHDPTVPPNASDLDPIQARFTELYPRIHRLASIQHRRLHGDQHDDAVGETIAWAWKLYRKKALVGEDPDPLLGHMVRFAAGHVRAGKLLGRSEARDVLSRLTRGQGNYRVASLPHADDEEASAAVRGALRHRVPGPAEEAACRIDYADWLATLTDKQRAVAAGLEAGLNLTEIAQQHGVTKAAVQAMRSTMARKWDERFGNAEEDQERSR
jgi:DNA-directed RNA polymerase specialized sigma24 family protein